eukprot:TRINITY_DN17178_c0_g1_i3.p1 TRINITY_DN17178_c0_g1~~TRINITY_DN17178_c0_g1_i3.p1  ORF type:complete len:374 (-),score=79.56 TRINITY_DN17178_c0_g1_i3:415-1536(-)
MVALWMTALLALAVMASPVMGFQCVPVSAPSAFCSGLTPSKVCAAGSSVDGSVLTETQYEADKNVTCPKQPDLFTQQIYCQGPWLPCVDNQDCSKRTHKRCFPLCLNGGVAAGRTFLGAEQCAKKVAPTTFCGARVQAGEVAAPGVTDCIGLTDFQNNHGRLQYGHSPWVPEQCKGTFPLFEVPMVEFGKQPRKEFMLALADKINGFWGLEDNDDESKFVRGSNLIARRVQVKDGVIIIYVEMTQFCLTPLRQGKWQWTAAHGKATNEYCDVPGPAPLEVFRNLSDWLDSRPEEEGMMVGDFWVHQEYLGVEPEFPKECYMWEAEEEYNPPQWVWCLVSIGACLLLLSFLIVQHRWRNSIARVRNNDKLRSYQ